MCLRPSCARALPRARAHMPRLVRALPCARAHTRRPVPGTPGWERTVGLGLRAIGASLCSTVVERGGVRVFVCLCVCNASSVLLAPLLVWNAIHHDSKRETSLERCLKHLALLSPDVLRYATPPEWAPPPTEGNGPSKGQGEVARGQQAPPAADSNTTRRHANPNPPRKKKTPSGLSTHSDLYH